MRTRSSSLLKKSVLKKLVKPLGYQLSKGCSKSVLFKNDARKIIFFEASYGLLLPKVRRSRLRLQSMSKYANRQLVWSMQREKSNLTTHLPKRAPQSAGSRTRGTSVTDIESRAIALLGLPASRQFVLALVYTQPAVPWQAVYFP